MFKFIHAADIHLDSPLKGLQRYEGAPVDEIQQATRRALENLVNLAIEREVDFVLIAGDLYDGDWKDHNTGLFFVKQVSRLRDAGVAIYVITGNHDAANKMTRSLKLPENHDGSKVMLPSRKAGTVVLEELGVAIHGRGFSSAKVTDNVVTRYPARLEGCFNIGMLHTSLDSESEELHARYAPCKLSDLSAKQYDYWALGHVHRRIVRSDDPLVIYPGNIQGRHIREEGAKGCMLITVDDRGSAHHDFVPLDVFRWSTCDIDAKDCQHGEDVLDAFSSQLEQLTDDHEGIPLGIRVTVSGQCPAHQAIAADVVRWTNEIRGAALSLSSGSVWVEKVRFRTLPSRTTDASVSRDGPMGELLDYLDQLRSDASPLVNNSQWLDELNRKLPDALKTGAGTASDVAAIRELLDDVEAMLVNRLAAQEAEG